MPRYARKRRSYSTSRRRTTTKRSKVSPRLRSYGRKKYGGKTTKKRILNVTSTKKRNTMLSWSNTTSSGASATIAVGSAFVNAPTSGLFVFCPTAQSFNSDSLARNQASRSATTCYMVGFSEHIRIQTSSGLSYPLLVLTYGAVDWVGVSDLSMPRARPFLDSTDSFSEECRDKTGTTQSPRSSTGHAWMSSSTKLTRSHQATPTVLSESGNCFTLCVIT